VNLYYIWYGNWASTDPNNTTRSILTSFGQSIGGTPYFGINKTYNDSTGYVTGQVTYQNAMTDPGSQGSALSDSAVQTVVANALSGGKLGPPDPNGVYFVLTSKEVTETSGFCTQYCAWHTSAKINGNDIKFGFVGNPLQCPSACSAQSVTPNGDLAGDAMSNLIAMSFPKPLLIPISMLGSTGEAARTQTNAPGTSVPPRHRRRGEVQRHVRVQELAPAAELGQFGRRFLRDLPLTALQQVAFAEHSGVRSV